MSRLMPTIFYSERLSLSIKRTAGFGVRTLLGCALLFTTACDQAPRPVPATPTATASSSSTPTIVAMPDLSNVTAIDISMQRTAGLSRPARASQQYHLDRVGERLEGQAEFRASDYDIVDVSLAVTGIVVPEDAFRKFLQRLAEAKPPMGSYDCGPLRGPGDAPELRFEMKLYLPSETVSFSSCAPDADYGSISLSNGSNYPWVVEFGGSTYLVHTAVPGEAYLHLKPHLKYDELQAWEGDTFYQRAPRQPMP